MRAQKIRELVRILEESQVHELEITYWWGRKIRISKSAAPAQSSAAVVKSQPNQIEIVTSPATGAAPAAAPSPAADTPSTPYLEIRAPMVGTFYRAPAPDAAAYVKEGDHVSPGKVLCIIEAMKLMNEIEAEVSGRIVKIMVENGRPVEYNQTLFLIDPR